MGGSRVQSRESAAIRLRSRMSAQARQAGSSLARTAHSNFWRVEIGLVAHGGLASLAIQLVIIPSDVLLAMCSTRSTMAAIPSD